MRIVTFALLGFACAAQRQAPPSSSVAMARQYRTEDGALLVGGEGPKGKFLCEHEMPLGSHIPKQVCRYVDEDADSYLHRDQTRQAMAGIETGVCVSKDGATCAH